MSSFIVHLLIPLLVLLAFRLAPPKAALLLVPLALVHDVDYWIGAHRALLHNIFIVVPAIALWYHWRDEHPKRATYAGVAAYYLASHLVMDLFVGGAVLLYPILNLTLRMNCRVLVRTETDEIIPICNPETEAGAPTVAEIYTWISPFEISMVAWTLLVLVGVMGVRWWRSRSPP